MEKNNGVLDATRGDTSRLQGEKGSVISTKPVYDYKNPFIPKGFEYLKGEWEKGLTIINKIDKSQFVWVPVGYLDADGTLDNQNFNEKFGRRNFMGEKFGADDYYENVDDRIIKSVKQYEGFFLAAHLASTEKGNLVFKKGNMPLLGVEQGEAIFMAEHYGDELSEIMTFLPCGAMYDSVFKWIIQSGEKEFDEVVYDSKLWGNFMNNEHSKHRIMPTGSNESWYACGLYDLAGNCDEWTTERSFESRIIARGSNFNNFGWWAAARRYRLNPCHRYYDVSFRVAFCLK